MQSKLRNLILEAKRLIPLTFSLSGIKSELKFKSPERWPTSFVFDKDRDLIDDPNSDTGGFLERKRDHLDQILDTIGYWVDLYIFRFKCEMCNHDRDQCYYSWNGEPEYGYHRQLECGKCGDSLRDDRDCSRYTSDGLNHGPIPGADAPPWVRGRYDPYGWDVT